ncbi:MAG: hypothetical protein ACR2NR_14860 [Solirubrobacteraceae bacterium]
MRKLLTSLWKLTGGPIHERLFRRYFQATLSRQDMTLAQLGLVQAQVQELRRACESEVARVEALRLQVRELDVQVRNALAARWDDAALSRRMTALEDRLRAEGKSPA